ncbi:long-chain-acyl-CoA synthetase [Oleiphilus sp. HI0071]|uniref:long-chain-acyl-CoA synthetase n=1 Tax=unclassified Oleiphilus TaxID=2631174 RepID=UPI0007C38647|nr:MULTISPECIES: long-chain-acyl-CoA synthetase [unclassified Oleiphilus]KZY60787.1 long-chain-acyl-CoA synthetase [Oleiphilus sp. HI0065]KZY86486.1 long-chain-acyl-CoA synthetase [Oleiphilus sp. HI0071]KZZ06042.1 long-chain-acyl-CoA synthetase [Oleiphilus sp. HI0073]KZZ51399.1 long-chain-acyl-CoA synthetase [Oleiphilus sp. HI0122]KZZ51528.1 long-chain-acyl-CoA synthetase [Oleiphilus sp. HI0118]KZZ66612.1 long-chain-acyl-CoA synthetase [Oleiphilus sp. HI0130]
MSDSISNGAPKHAFGAQELLSHAPELVRGLPKKAQGLFHVARQSRNPKNGLARCIEKTAKKYPSKDAVVFEGRRLTYAAFNEQANRMARYLVETGTQRGDVIVVAMENRPELLITVTALAKIGAVSALINTSQRQAVLKHSVSLVKPARLIVGAELFDAFDEIQECLPSGDHARLWVADLAVEQSRPQGYTDLLEAAQSVADVSNPSSSLEQRANDPLCYFYTSGTTGLPKAAVLTNGRYMKAYGGIGQACIQLKPNDRVYVPLPFYHATALVVAWSSIIAGGACLVLARKFSASQYWDDVIDNRVTALCYIGELCRYLIAKSPSEQDRQHQVKLMFGNGLRPEIWQAFKARFGIERVHEFYGSSEGNVGFMNVFNLDNTVGLSPMPYAIVEYDIDADAPIRFGDGFMRKVEKGQAGLLLGEISDKSPFDGYTEPEKTEKTILRNVFKQGDAWFNTGDMMRDMGYRHAQFVDRLGDTFRWKGENVSTTEVENILGQCSGVIDAVVYGVEIPKTNGRAGMAALRMKNGADLDFNEMLGRLQEELPAYAVPLFVRFVDEIESTGTHKYKKAPLKNDAYDPDKCGKHVYVLLPGESDFQQLTKDIFKKIEAAGYRF